MLYRAPVCRLKQDETGRVTGVIAKTGDDEYAEYLSERGVILATGDFSANPDMMAKYCPTYAKYFRRGGDDYSIGFAEGGLYRGEGHRMALWAGRPGSAHSPTRPSSKAAACAPICPTAPTVACG